MCDLCSENAAVVETRDGKKICFSCAQVFHFCEICGSIAHDTNPDNQLHYEELCFK